MFYRTTRIIEACVKPRASMLARQRRHSVAGAAAPVNLPRHSSPTTLS
jgi:hypothetical protein